LDRLALDHDVQAVVPGVAAGGEDHVRMVLKVERLLLFRTGAEVQPVLGPDRHQRSDVRPTVCTHRG
jgi:hypothetical protein